MNDTTLWICCGVLRKEMEYLISQGDISGEMMFWDSMLHMVPLELEKRLSLILSGMADQVRPMVLVVGDCSPHMLNIAEEYKIGRVDAINCEEMLFGKSRYKELMHAGAFIVLPEWALRWKEIMNKELGLYDDVAKEFMQDSRMEMVYCDTGLHAVPYDILHTFSEYTGLPLMIEKVDMCAFTRSLHDAEAHARQLIGEE